tara:strand:- start:2274 stop:3083 length:810 start_codon:yes stop_codon:yes gene_type:complete
MPVGYRMASFDFDKLQVVTKQFGHSVNVNDKNEIHFDKGLYLGSDKGFLEYYRDDPDPDERRQDIVLEYEYDSTHLLQGDGSPDQELVVSHAKLKNAAFFDEDMQVEWGHLLDSSQAAERRARMEGGQVNLGSELGYVIRAQDAKMDYLMDCDYCYRHSGLGLYESGCKEVAHNLEEGEEQKHVHARMLEMALTHAITMAITSGLPKKVMLYTVRNGELFEANNAGEYFYKGDPKKSGRALFEVSPEGEVSVPERRRAIRKELEQSLSV